MVKKFLEFKKSDLYPIESFIIKDELNPKLWDNFEINEEVKDNLLDISKDFYDGLSLDAEIKDIILTGSLANYNWSSYSDYDLHILIDFKDIDTNVELVKKYVDAARTIWNENHDIQVEGYEVEVYIQDINEKHTSTGIYSLLHNKWNVKPVRTDFQPDIKLIALKGEDMMNQIDSALETKGSYDEVSDKIAKVWDKVKKMRKAGLEEEGEFSVGNLVFKLLRRNEYIKKIIDFKRSLYDKKFS